jgi:hypothetical protein
VPVSPREVVGGERIAELVEHLEACERLRSIAREQLSCRFEADGARGRIVCVDEPAIGGLDDDPLVDGPHDGLQLLP